jgi:hypothetical protein
MATTNAGLVGRVAEILNHRELVITLGRGHGIHRGMKFAVLTDPLEVKDPETGDLLDVLEREKIRVEAFDVRDRISVCRTYRSIPEEDVERRWSQGYFESFSVEGEGMSQHRTFAQEYVKVGDRVVGLADDES